jgi:hypothetical protein
MCRECSTNGGEEECIEDIGGKARRKEPLRKPRRRCMGNVACNLLLGGDQEIGDCTAARKQQQRNGVSCAVS